MRFSDWMFQSGGEGEEVEVNITVRSGFFLVRALPTALAGSLRVLTLGRVGPDGALVCYLPARKFIRKLLLFL